MPFCRAWMCPLAAFCLSKLPPMSNSLPVLALICALFVIYCVQMRAFLQARKHWEELEARFRQREDLLIDRLLIKSGNSPLIERERVVKLPDPEVKQPSWIEEAFQMDGIMEEAERLLPEARGQTPEWVRDMYPGVWMEAEARYRERTDGLRL